MLRAAVIVLLALLSLASSHGHSRSERSRQRSWTPCIIGHQCDDDENCNTPVIGKRVKPNECAPLLTRNVFGADDRVAVRSTAYPWSAIGKLIAGGGGCTATLVGRDVVLTAAHCVINPKTKKLYTDAMYFYPNMIDGKAKLKARVTYTWYGTNDPDTYRASDWAVLRVNTKLGDTQSWLGVKTVSLDEMKRTSGILVGYADNFMNGQTAGATYNCRILKQESPNLYLDDCDMGRGASGGPIFAYWSGKPYVYALNVAEYRNGGDISLTLANFNERNANIAIWSTAIVNKVIEFQKS